MAASKREVSGRLLGSMLGRTHEAGWCLAGTAAPALAHAEGTPFEFAEGTGLKALRARRGSHVLAEVAAKIGGEECPDEGP